MRTKPRPMEGIKQLREDKFISAYVSRRKWALRQLSTARE